MKFKKVAFVLTLISAPIVITSCGNTVIEKKLASLFLNYDETKGTIEASSYNGYVGDTITLTITPNSNYSINKVTYNGLTIEVNNNTCSIVIAQEGKNEVNITFKVKYDENATHDGTVDSPYTVKEAKDVIDGLGTGSSSTTLSDSGATYTYGVISSIDNVSTSYGNATFNIKSANEEITVWRAYYLGNVKFTDKNAIKVGDKVIVYGTLTNYKTTYEISDKCYIYSLNGKTSSSSSGNGGSSTSGGSTDSGSTSGGSSSGSTTGGENYPSDPGTYYSSITDDMTGGENGTLRKALTSLCKPKDSYKYSGTGSNTLSSLLQSTSEDPNNSENMIYFYTQKSVKKNAAQTWNREHTWPQSLSGGLYGTDGAGCDALHIMPTYNTTNSIRGNLKYGYCTNGTVRTYEGVDFAKTGSGYFEPMDSVKGDCARIVLYMYTVYFIERGTSINNVCSSLSTMIEWSKLDPVDVTEVNRNNKVAASKQKNRNPYVDHPEWIDKVFGSSN